MAKKPVADWPAQSRFKIYVQSIALTPDAILLANSSYMRLGILRRATKTPEEVELPGAPQGLALSPDKTEVAFVHGEFTDLNSKLQPSTLVIADARTGAIKATLPKVDADPQGILWSPDGELFLVHSYPEKLALYRAADVRAGKLKPIRFEAASGGGPIVFLPDSKSLLQLTSENLVRYALDGKAKAGPRPQRWSSGSGMAIAPDGTLAIPTAVFSQAGRVKWAEKTEEWAQDVEFSPDGSKLVCASAAFDFLRGKKAVSPKPKGMEVAYVAVHDAKDGKLLGWAQRPVKSAVRALAVDDERIVVGRDSGVDIFTWASLGLSPRMG